jgi:hypothetical protein
MARTHNQIVYATDLLGAINRATGIDPYSNGVERTGETLTPSFDPWEMPEWAYLRRECLWSRALNVGAVVGELGACAVSCPLATTWLVTVDYANFTGGTSPMSVQTGAVIRSVAAGTLTQVGNGTARDTRFGQPGLVQFLHQGLEVWSGSDPGGLISNVYDLLTIGNTDQKPSAALPVILKPGAAWLVQATTANQSFIANFGGRVRQALPGELV